MTDGEQKWQVVPRRISAFMTANDDRKMSTISLITIGIMLIDYTISTFYQNIGPSLNSLAGVFLFGVIIIAIYGFGSPYLLRFCKERFVNLRGGLGFTKLHDVMRIIQYALLILFVTMLVQMILTNQYFTGFYVAATAIGAFPAVIMQGLLGYKLLSWWYRTDRRNIMILLLGLSASTGALAQMDIVDIVDVVLSEKPAVIDPHTSVNFDATFPPHIGVPYGEFIMVAVLSGLLEWAGIALLLRHFSKTMGQVKYWLIVCLPAAGLLAGMLPVIITSPSDYSQFTAEMIVFRIITVFGASSLYVMWAVGYLTVARSLRRVNQKNVTASYMTLSAVGIILLGYAYATPAFFATFPPFGVAAHSLLALGVYLFSFGFYASAVSVSQDAKLRRSMKNAASEELRLVRSIGNAQEEGEILKKVLLAAKKSSEVMKLETGIDVATSEEDAKNYLMEVMEELKKERTKDSKVQDQNPQG